MNFPLQRVYQAPGTQPVDGAANVAYGEQHQVSLGAPVAADASMLRDDAAFNDYQKIPAFFTISIVLGGEAGAVKGGNVQLRPEAFICERITWACSESPLQYVIPFATDETNYTSGAAIGGSPQGRAVRISWGDEFTKFLGDHPCMLAALFGDGDGFLNLSRGILFQGKQTLTATLSRISDPTFNQAPQLEFDINFQGVGLLPKNVAQSGSAG